MDFLKYWGLNEKPFENTGDPRFFYYSPVHKEALVRLIYVIREHKAGALLAGDYGTGKTTIAHELLLEIRESDDYQSIFIKNPLLTAKELLQEVAYQMGVTKSTSARLKVRHAIEENLRETAEANRHTVIIVDEAHLVSRNDVLEELRLLMNLQHKNKFLASIIMMGQLELKDIINAVPQFKQRFAMFYVLKHLGREETSGYIPHRLKIAGLTRPVFTEKAYGMIHEASSGMPRQINNICDMSLLVGCMKESDTIDEDIIRDVVKDLGEEI